MVSYVGEKLGGTAIRVAIVEDDSHYIRTIRDFVDRFATKTGVEFQIYEFHDGSEILDNYRPVYDLVLLDIEMPCIDGMRTAEQIRAQDEDVILIFITNMAQYAIQGYKVRAQSYILKPVGYYGFAAELQDAINTLDKRSSRKSLLLTVDGDMIKVPVSAIRYIESNRHNLIVHTVDRIYTIRETMKNMEKSLEGEPFAHAGISFLVNLAHVTGVQGDMAVMGAEPDRVPISRQRRKPFMEALANYVGGGGRPHE